MKRRFTAYLVCSFFILSLMAGCGSRAPVNTIMTVNSSSKTEDSRQASKQPLEKQDENDINEDKDNAGLSSVNKDSEKINESPKTENKKVIVIDAGHGGKSGNGTEPLSPDSNEMKPKNVSGAAGIKTRTPEHVIALEVSRKLKELLEKDGYTVIMTRNSADETISNMERAEIGNKNNADLVIRIHADSSTNSSIQGASMLVPAAVGYAKDIYKISRQYGENIFKTLLNDVKMNSRGVIERKDLTGFNWSKVPVVLIEMGFLSNIEEDKLLTSSEYQEKIAEGLCKGIENSISK